MHINVSLNLTHFWSNLGISLAYLLGLKLVILIRIFFSKEENLDATTNSFRNGTSHTLFLGKWRING